MKFPSSPITTVGMGGMYKYTVTHCGKSAVSVGPDLGIHQLTAMTRYLVKCMHLGMDVTERLATCAVSSPVSSGSSVIEVSEQPREEA